MLIVFTGNGKGKTTAALGQAFRMLGRGRRVLMLQFIKGPWRSGEDELVGKFKAQKAKFNEGDEKLWAELQNFYDFHIKKLGLGFVGIQGDTLPKERHIEAAREAFEYFKTELATGAWHLIILDEINVALSLGLLEIGEVKAALATVPEERFVLCTGRGAPEELIAMADLVTEMLEVKHPFNDGAKAKIAMEF